MGSQIVIKFLVIFLATVLLLSSSEVTCRNLAEISNNVNGGIGKANNQVQDCGTIKRCCRLANDFSLHGCLHCCPLPPSGDVKANADKKIA
ncbi:hypothetical protein OROGR_018510 [Orobanche gracilis]